MTRSSRPVKAGEASPLSAYEGAVRKSAEMAEVMSRPTIGHPQVRAAAEEALRRNVPSPAAASRARITEFLQAKALLIGTLSSEARIRIGMFQTGMVDSTSTLGDTAMPAKSYEEEISAAKKRKAALLDAFESLKEAAEASGWNIRVGMTEARRLIKAYDTAIDGGEMAAVTSVSAECSRMLSEQ